MSSIHPRRQVAYPWCPLSPTGDCHSRWTDEIEPDRLGPDRSVGCGCPHPRFSAGKRDVGAQQNPLTSDALTNR